MGIVNGKHASFVKNIWFRWVDVQTRLVKVLLKCAIRLSIFFPFCMHFRIFVSKIIFNLCTVYASPQNLARPLDTGHTEFGMLADNFEFLVMGMHDWETTKPWLNDVRAQFVVGCGCVPCLLCVCLACSFLTQPRHCCSLLFILMFCKEITVTINDNAP